MKKEVELYEMIYLLNPRFSQQEISTKTEYYQAFLTAQGSQVMIQNRGKRSLSYPIKGYNTATYIQMVYLGNGELVNLLNKELSRDESILRTILTRLPKKIAQLK